MKYTKEDLKIDNSDLPMSSIYIYKGSGPYDNGWIGEAKGSHVGPEDSDERRGNAILFSKANRMYETLIMAMSCIVNHGSPELIEKYDTLITEIENEFKRKN